MGSPSPSPSETERRNAEILQQLIRDSEHNRRNRPRAASCPELGQDVDDYSLPNTPEASDFDEQLEDMDDDNQIEAGQTESRDTTRVSSAPSRQSHDTESNLPSNQRSDQQNSSASRMTASNDRRSNEPAQNSQRADQGNVAPLTSTLPSRDRPYNPVAMPIFVPHYSQITYEVLKQKTDTIQALTKKLNYDDVRFAKIVAEHNKQLKDTHTFMREAGIVIPGLPLSPVSTDTASSSGTAQSSKLNAEAVGLPSSPHPLALTSKQAPFNPQGSSIISRASPAKSEPVTLISLHEALYTSRPPAPHQQGRYGFEPSSPQSMKSVVSSTTADPGSRSTSTDGSPERRRGRQLWRKRRGSHKKSEQRYKRQAGRNAGSPLKQDHSVGSDGTRKKVDSPYAPSESSTVCASQSPSKSHKEKHNEHDVNAVVSLATRTTEESVQGSHAVAPSSPVEAELEKISPVKKIQDDIPAEAVAAPAVKVMNYANALKLGQKKAQPLPTKTVESNDKAATTPGRNGGANTACRDSEAHPSTHTVQNDMTLKRPPKANTIGLLQVTPPRKEKLNAEVVTTGLSWADDVIEEVDASQEKLKRVAASPATFSWASVAKASPGSAKVIDVTPKPRVLAPKESPKSSPKQDNELEVKKTRKKNKKKKAPGVKNRSASREVTPRSINSDWRARGEDSKIGVSDIVRVIREVSDTKKSEGANEGQGSNISSDAVSRKPTWASHLKEVSERSPVLEQTDSTKSALTTSFAALDAPDATKRSASRESSEEPYSGNTTKKADTTDTPVASEIAHRIEGSDAVKDSAKAEAEDQGTCAAHDQSTQSAASTTSKLLSVPSTETWASHLRKTSEPIRATVGTSTAPFRHASEGNQKGEKPRSNTLDDSKLAWPELTVAKSSFENTMPKPPVISGSWAKTLFLKPVPMFDGTDDADAMSNESTKDIVAISTPQKMPSAGSVNAQSKITQPEKANVVEAQTMMPKSKPADKVIVQEAARVPLPPSPVTQNRWADLATTGKRSKTFTPAPTKITESKGSACQQFTRAESKKPVARMIRNDPADNENYDVSNLIRQLRPEYRGLCPEALLNPKGCQYPPKHCNLDFVCAFYAFGKPCWFADTDACRFQHVRLNPPPPRKATPVENKVEEDGEWEQVRGKGKTKAKGISGGKTKEEREWEAINKLRDAHARGWGTRRDGA